MIPTAEDVESYLDSIQELFSSSLAVVTPDLPNVRETFHRLWVDVQRYGPPGWSSSFPEIHLPGLGDFEVPPPPPPPPLPKSVLQRSVGWATERPKTAAGVAAALIGTGLLVGYGSYYVNGRVRARKLQAGSSNERRQAVVVLGGDTPYGLPLIQDLERKGYIVIVSVSTPEAVDEIERRSHGYVRALVLDPQEPGTLPFFLRSLASTLSRRFPINAPGDPHASLSNGPYVHSVICLLTLPSPATSILPAPFEHIDLTRSYMPYLGATHIMSLQVIQDILPLMRTNPAMTRDAAFNDKGDKSIVVCLPAIDARVGLPFNAAQAMSAAATLRGVEVLRREIQAAALTDPSHAMKNINVVVVDVGSVDLAEVALPHRMRAAIDGRAQDVYRTMRDWTPSEQAAYGNAYTAIIEGGHQHGTHRKPATMAEFVDAMIGVVSGGRKSGATLFGIGLGFGKIRNWIRGHRFSVGAGAGTYAVASYLPPLLLDALLNLPHFLVSVRNALLPVPPHVPSSQTTRAAAPTSTEKKLAEEDSPPSSDQEHHSGPETGSEADVESNAGDGSGVAESWVNLHDRSLAESQTTGGA